MVEMWPSFLGPMTLFLALTGQAELSKGIAYGLGAFGLVGLYTSILVPTDVLRRRHGVRLTVAAFLVLGVIAALVMAFTPSEEGLSIASRPELFQVWLLGGPIAVALWNIARLLRQSPAAAAA